MPRGYSAGLKTEIYATGSDDPPLVLVEITHPNLATPVRVVNDTQSLTSQGAVYAALGFRVTLPDEQEGQIPRAQLGIDNIGRELMQWLDTSSGGRGAEVRLQQVRRSDPDTVEYEIIMDLADLRANGREVLGSLGYDALTGPVMRKRYDVATAPGGVVSHWTDRWVGVPYQARTHDCAWFAVTVQQTEFARVPTLPVQSRWRTASQRAADITADYGDATEHPQDGDAVVMRDGAQGWHVGVMAWIRGEAWVLHSTKSHGASHLTRLRLLGREGLTLEGFYRWRVVQ